MEDYSELCQALDIEDFEYITGQRDWSIVKLNDRYWYYEHPVEGASDVFYEANCTAEYIFENYDVTGEQAVKLGYEVRRLMGKYGGDEEDTIPTAFENLGLEVKYREAK